MKIGKTFTITSLLLANAAFAQLATTPEQAATLKAMEAKFRKNFEADRSRADAVAKATSQTLRYKGTNGEIVEFAGFAANGQMLFNKTENLVSGQTISVNKVWPGGSAGTSLTGAGLPGRLGEWDGSAARTTHQEFGGRVTVGDGTVGNEEHATHVAGTMVASGVDGNAKGMSYAATLISNDWNSDEAEMTSAAANGMLLSNHSYGTICGWYQNSTLGRMEWYGDPSISATVDYKFGYYDQQAAEWDDIAYSNPYYLICKAAGNDRSDTYTGSHWVRDLTGNWVQSSATRSPDGQYDCIAGSAVSKNVLTVGAVNKIPNGWSKLSDVSMSSFSGWGPVDDGRIKPDVVAAGVNVYSSTNTSNTAYATLSGTSMATPAVTGALLLVQQHYNNRKGKFMWASTLKGLAIHTADEAGNIGPDYIYGWGLVNISKAIAHINDTTYSGMEEKTLTNAGANSTYTKVVTSDGTKPMRITICWTDLAGTPVAPALNPTDKMLVNDLDIRLTRNSDGVVFMPYILNPAVPAGVATTGDNVRDNVEQIYLSAPQSGVYTVTVSHKNALSAPQNFSMLISGVTGRPVAAFTSDIVSACTGQNITFTDLSTGLPTIRKWYFPGGTPATSTAASPVVTYSAPGKYPVALKVTSALGTDSVYVADYINVGSISLPFLETFESNSPTLSQWHVYNPDNDTTWTLGYVAGPSSGITTAAYIPIYNYANSGQRDGLISPTFSLKGFTTLNLSFKHAYARYFGSSDSLIVYLSTNCGTTWQRIASKGGSTMNTISDQSAQFVPSATTQWCGNGMASCFSVNLTPWIGLDNVKIMIESYNALGNNIYIDNVSLNGVPIKPVANFGMQSTTVCAGQPVNFFDSSQNPVSTWQWTFSGANVTTSNVQNPTGITYSTPGNYTVKLRVSNSTGSDSITRTNYVTVLPAMAAPVVTASGPLTFCSGDNVVLTSDSATSYKWYKDNVAINGENGRTLTVSSAGTYKVEVQNAAGCVLQSSDKVVVVNNTPAPATVTSSITASIFCTGGTVVLTSSAPSGNLWYKNGSLISGATGVTYNVTDSGSYTVRVSGSPCASAPSAPKVYALYPKPVTSSITGSTASNNNKTENYSVTATAGSSYTWTVTNGTQTSGTNTSSIQVKWGSANTGSLTVRETASTGCKADVMSLNVTLTPPAGIDEVTTLGGLKVYPNPADQVIWIEFESMQKQPVEVSLINIIGQKMASDKVTAFSGHYKQQLNVNDLPKGVYFVEVKGESVSRQVKIVIQ